MSAKTTVTVRRDSCDSWGPGASRDVPHSRQNLARSGFSWPQAGHRIPPILPSAVNRGSIFAVPRPVLLAVLLAGALLPAGATAAEWPTFGGDLARTGFNPG